MSKSRVALIVLDSLGIGALPDAEKYGDVGANTFGHIIDTVPDIKIANLRDIGFCNIQGAKEKGLGVESPKGSFARMAEMSTGKDTITGHWEIAGLHTEIPFKTFPDGFPAEFMQRFEEAIGKGTLGNYAASGTEILEELGEEHAKTGKPIVYTSADSVFQIAINIELNPLEELYKICETAREMLIDDVNVGRVIARPFVGEKGNYQRTSDRKDYAVSPSDKTVLDKVKEAGYDVHAVGKISDIFNDHGITTSAHTDSNMDGINKTIDLLKSDATGFIFTNLVDFDSKYGHRRDAKGYAEAIEEFDAKLPEIIDAMREEDILMLCADHGNDPCHPGWDHTREAIPMVIYGKSIKQGLDLGERKSFADIGATIAEVFGAENTNIGTTFLKEVQV